MTLWQDDHEFLFQQQLAVELDLIDRRAKEPYINFTFVKSLVLDGGKNILALDVNGRQAPTQVSDRSARDSAQSGSNPNFDNTRLAFLRMTGCLSRVSSLHDQFSRFIQKSTSPFG